MVKELCFWNEKNRGIKRDDVKSCVWSGYCYLSGKEMQKCCSFDFIELLSVDLCFTNSLYSFNKQCHWNWIRFFSWNEMKSISQHFTEWINYSFLLFSITQKVWIVIEWIIDSNNRTIIKQKIKYVSTMKRDKEEREDCEMNVDYSMKKKKSRNELWWISQIKMNSNVYLNVIAFDGHLFKWTVGMLCVWCCLFEEKRE